MVTLSLMQRGGGDWGIAGDIQRGEGKPAIATAAGRGVTPETAILTRIGTGIPAVFGGAGFQRRAGGVETAALAGIVEPAGRPGGLNCGHRDDDQRSNAGNGRAVKLAHE